MTVLRLERRSRGPFGPVLAELGQATFCRQPGSAHAVVAGPPVAEAVRAFAFAGIAAVPCDIDVRPPRDLLLARGLDLTPLPGLDVFDVVRIERVPLGRATREMLRRRWAGILPPDDAARARCRSLLRGEDVLVAWDRRVWGSRAALRSPAARRVLRPVVFDRADDPPMLRGRARASDDAVARWLWS